MMHTRIFMAGALTALAGLSAVCAIAADAPTPPAPDRAYTQTLVLEFATPSEAGAARLEICPVLDGKAWAFSARWDDSRQTNLRMAKLMQTYNWPGTFYLNETGRKVNYIGRDYVRQLVATGSDIGGHSQTHDILTALNPNEMFYELLANRVEKEVQSGRPIHSFAFPFGRFRSKADPRVLEAMSSAFTAAGYHHSTYSGFVEGNRHLAPGAVSAAIQTRPGDRNVDLPRYAKQLESILANRETRSRESHCIYLGIHVAYQDEGWDDIEAVFAKYAHRKDVWYCTLNQYAAYEWQRQHSTIRRTSLDGSRATFEITRPSPAAMGADVPMTVEVLGAGFRGVVPPSNACSRLPDPTRVLLDLASPPNQSVPAEITAFDNLQNAPRPPVDAGPAGVGPAAHLYCDVKTQTLHLTLTNPTATPITDIRLTWRLPPMAQSNVSGQRVETLAPGQQRTLTHAIGELRPGAWYRDGRAYFVAECDATLGDKAIRVFATTRLPAMPPETVAVRDAAWMLGPIPAADATPSSVEGMSRPAAALVAIGKDAWQEWFLVGEDDRRRYASDRVTLYRYDKAWNKRMSSTVNRPRDFLVAVDFELSEAASLAVDCELPVRETYLNGKKLPAASGLSGTKGPNRLVLRLATKDDRSGFKPYAALLHIAPKQGVLTYRRVEPSP